MEKDFFVRKQYLICPFTEYDDVVTTMLKKYELKVNCEILKTGNDILKNVEDDATLLIAGHGVESGREISNGLKEGRQAMDVETLAAKIGLTWELPVTHIKIRLLGCECAGFACTLAKTLLGYESICVGGFIDSVIYDNYDEKTGRGSAMVLVEIEPGVVQPFSKEVLDKKGIKRVRWYNNKGEEIEKVNLKRTIKLG